MSAAPPRKDLVLLVADKNMEASLKGLLSRARSLGFREVTFDLYVHPDRDPGCLHRAHDFLRSFANRYERALVVLDHEGCGRDRQDRGTLELVIEGRLSDSGWQDRAAAVVIAPELEIWVWSDSPHVETALGWGGQSPALKDWLISSGYLAPGQRKPDQPKTAVEKALRIARRPRSSALYLQLAQKVGFERCTDEAFLKLKTTLRRWFAKEEDSTS